MPENVHGGAPVLLEGGEYARFIYQGPPHDLQDFILALYGTCACRRKAWCAVMDAISNASSRLSANRTRNCRTRSAASI